MWYRSGTPTHTVPHEVLHYEVYSLGNEYLLDRAKELLGPNPFEILRQFNKAVWVCDTPEAIERYGADEYYIPSNAILITYDDDDGYLFAW